VASEESYTGNEATLALLKDAAQRQIAEEERLGDIKAQGQTNLYGALGAIAPNAIKQYQATRQADNQNRYAEENSALNQQALQKGAIGLKESQAEEDFLDSPVKSTDAPVMGPDGKTPIPSVDPGGEPLTHREQELEAKNMYGQANLAQGYRGKEADIASTVQEKMASRASQALTESQTRTADVARDETHAGNMRAIVQNSLNDLYTGQFDAKGNPIGDPDIEAKGLALMAPQINSGVLTRDQASAMLSAAKMNVASKAAGLAKTNLADQALNPEFQQMQEATDKVTPKINAVEMMAQHYQDYTSNPSYAFWDSVNGKAARDAFASEAKAAGFDTVAANVNDWHVGSTDSNIKSALNDAYKSVKSQAQGNFSGVSTAQQTNPIMQSQINRLQVLGRNPNISDPDAMSNVPGNYSNAILKRNTPQNKPKPSWATPPQAAGPTAAAPGTPGAQAPPQGAAPAYNPQQWGAP